MSIIENKKRTLRGDTLIEVLFAVAIFAMVAISAATLMNSMLGKSQSAIETVMARSEIDAQAEAIRFIHSSRKNDSMKEVWKKIDSSALNSNDSSYNIDDFLLKNVSSCNEFTSNSILRDNAFYIDTFELGSNIPPIEKADKIYGTTITTTATFPRVFHASHNDTISSNFDSTTGDKAEGVWVVAVRDNNDAEHANHYDFYIQTCWDAVNSAIPTTINTIIRLRNPTKIAATTPGNSNNSNSNSNNSNNSNSNSNNSNSSSYYAKFFNGTTEIQTLSSNSSNYSVSPLSATKTGYTFTGWKLNNTGNIITDPKTGATPGDTNANKYYAQFDVKNYDVSVTYPALLDGTTKDLTESSTISCEKTAYTTTYDIYGTTSSVDFIIDGKSYTAKRGSSFMAWIISWKAKITIDCSGSSVSFSAKKV